MNWWEWVTLAAAVLGAYFGVVQYLDQRRYPEFLKRAHAQAAVAAKTPSIVLDLQGEYRHPTVVNTADLELAFRAYADHILFLHEGKWYCAAAAFEDD